jgi:hypothetical protein
MNPSAHGLKSCLQDGYRIFVRVLVWRTLAAALAAVVNGALIDNGLSSPFYLRGMILRLVWTLFSVECCAQSIHFFSAVNFDLWDMAYPGFETQWHGRENINRKRFF